MLYVLCVICFKLRLCSCIVLVNGINAVNLSINSVKKSKNLTILDKLKNKFMNTNRILISTVLMLAISVLFFQCKKENEDIGVDLISKNDRINVVHTDTITVATYTDKIDKIQTDNVVRVLVGSYIDPIFGLTSASFATQMLMSNSSLHNDSVTASNITIDSLIVKFSFPPSGMQFYGNGNKECTMNISKINQFLESDKDYYSNYDVSKLNANLIHSYKFKPKQVIDNANLLAQQLWQDEVDSALAKGDDTSKIKKKEPQPFLTIKMPNKVRDEVYHALVRSVKNNATFVEEFKGLYLSIADESKNSAISVLDYGSINTGAFLYYHKNDKPKETKIYPLLFNQYTTHFNIFNHEFSKGNILADLSENSTKLDTVVYLQGMGGLNTRIKFPYINKMLESGERWAVTKAQLVFSVPQDANILEKQYPAPKELMLYRVDENGEWFELQEFYHKKNYLGELYSDNQYVFDITLFMQRIFKGDYTNSDLILKVKHDAINPARVVLGANGSSRAVKLKLVASRL